MPTRVLLIDDDPKLHGLLKTYLAPHEVVLAHAADGRRGLVPHRIDFDTFMRLPPAWFCGRV